MVAVEVLDRTVSGDRESSLEDRIIDAALACVGQWGVAKTTADDVARSAGVSRATLYRVFPGGKEVLFEATVGRELVRFFEAVTERLDAASSLDELVVEGIAAAARHLQSHSALGYLLTYEPHLVLPSFAFHRLDRALAIATDITAPHLRRFAAAIVDAEADAEWLIRMVLSYAINPTARLDLTDVASVGRFVRTYVLPGLAATRQPIT
jgi:AcrR family transcriptional regulator